MSLFEGKGLLSIREVDRKREGRRGHCSFQGHRHDVETVLCLVELVDKAAASSLLCRW